MSIRRLGDTQLYGPTSQATASYPAGVMLSAADYATWEQQANAANQTSYSATVAAYAAMTPAAPPAAPVTTTPATVPASTPPAVCPAWGCDGPPVLIPVPITPASQPATPAVIPTWVYWAAAAAGLFLISKAL